MKAIRSNSSTSANHNSARGAKMNVLGTGSRLGFAIQIGLIAGFLSGSAHAIDFSNGELSGSWDTTVTYGASWRIEERQDEMVGMANLNPFISLTPYADQLTAPGRWSVNNDDGNLNYDDGDLISNALKITTELGFSYGDFGGFFRGSVFYDFENEGREGLSEIAQDFVGTDYTLLDAFLYADFDASGHYGTVRVGRQVVSWGESTFIQGGINVVNAVDVSKLRVAGAELKEALLPLDMIWGTVDLTENLSVEGLYMFEFEQIDPDPAGTYFSTNDFGTPGAEFVMLGFGRYEEYTPGLSSVVGSALAGASYIQQINRLPDRYASNSGQYGIAFRYFAPQLADSEFGLFYLNYHSRLPILSGIAVSNSSPRSGGYFVEYPEDIHLLGLSFNSVLGATGVAIAGEMSYRSNVPLQFDDVELLFAALTPLNSAVPAPVEHFQSQIGSFQVGEEIRGWERHEVSQMQFTLTKIFGPSNFFKADQMVLLGEFGATKVWDMPDKSVIRYNGPGTDTGGGPDQTAGYFRNPMTQVDGFADSFSWGYRLITRLDYSNAFGTSVNLFPRLAFNHDVNGISPGPGGQFVEGRKSITVGLNGLYLEKWSSDFSYTRFFGAGNRNLLQDRDFVAFNIKYSF